MMYRLDFVNGLWYGGEGKGRIATYIASQYDTDDTLDVLLCGGINRSCTVVREDGVRHSFRHFGSATMYGYATYLSSDFLIEPSTFRKEREQLLAMGIEPIVYVNSDCNVTLPYHILADKCYNKICDEFSGSECGIWQTTTYNWFTYDRFGMHRQPTTFSNLINKEKFDACARYFRDKNKFFSRIHEDACLDGYNDIIEQYYSLINKDELWEQCYEDLLYTKEHCIFVTGWANVKALGYKNFVCEFSHSLSLDQVYCTDACYTDVSVRPSDYSNLITLFGSYDDCKVTHNYVTRWYITRQGYNSDNYGNVIDENHPLINTENLHDEDNNKVYYGAFAPEHIASILSDEFHLAKRNVTHNVFLTCFDQVNNIAEIIHNDNKIEQVPPSEFLHRFVDCVDTACDDVIPNIYVCCGELPENIIQLDTGYSSINREDNYSDVIYGQPLDYPDMTVQYGHMPEIRAFDASNGYDYLHECIHYESSSRYR